MKWILIPLTLILTACDPTPPPQPETVRTPDPIFETQIKAMEKAHAAEGQMNDATEAQRQQMEAATQ
ncbi:MAG: hypothetical protein ACYCZT_05550 [Thiobacillus sp.]